MSIDICRRLKFRNNGIGFTDFSNCVKERWDTVSRNINHLFTALRAILCNKKFPVAKVDRDFGAVRKDELIHDERPRLVVEFTVYKTFCSWWADQETLGYGSCGLTNTLDEARADCSKRFSEFRVVEAIYAAND